MDPSLQLAKKISCESNIFKSKSIGNTPRIICDDDNFYRIKDSKPQQIYNLYSISNKYSDFIIL